MHATTRSPTALSLRGRRTAGFLATGFVLGLASTASAAVIYTDVVPDQVIEQRTFRIDPDGDGNPDIQFNHDLGCVGNCLSFADVGGLNGEVLLSQTSPDQFITPLAGGSVIGPGSATFGPGGKVRRG
jgi:hypothetical protein